MAVMDIKRPKPKPATNKPLTPIDTGLRKKLVVLITRRNVAIALAVILVLSVGLIGFRHQAHQQLNSSPRQNTAGNIQRVVTEVGKLVLLPSGQVPTVAIIKNVSELQNQSFYANAQDGDYILVYSQAKKAILYRPSINRVIEYSNTN